MKKLFAILLSLAMVMCMIPMATGVAFAESTAIDSVTLASSTSLFTGEDITFPAATVKAGEAEVNSGNYVASWSNGLELASQTGTYTYTVSGTNSYTGIKTAEFKILQVNINNADVKLASGKTAITADDLNGKTFNASNVSTNTEWNNLIQVVQDGEVVNSKVYELQVTSSTNAYGAIKLTFVAVAKAEYGTANVVGTSKTPLEQNITTDISGATVTVTDTNYTGSAIIPEVCVKVEGTTLTKGTDYTVECKNNINQGQATAVIKGTGKYSGSKTVNWNINRKPIASVTNIIVNNIAIGDMTPKAVISDNGNALIQGTDFQAAITSGDVSKAGTVTVTISGMGNYTGTVTKTATVVSAQYVIGSAKIMGIYDATYKYAAKYTGDEIKPEVYAYGGYGARLSINQDYRVSYINNIKIGEAKVIVTGIGSYSGYFEIPFTIEKADLTYANITLSQTSYAYDGTAKTPTPVVYLNNKRLTSGIDYSVEYSNHTNITTSTYVAYQPTVTIKGIGGYTGTAKAYFVITPKAISSCTAAFAGNATSIVYTGGTVDPVLTVSDGYNTLKKSYYSTSADGDYYVTIKNSKGEVVTSMRDADTYTYTITGLNNYTGTLTKTFTITGTSIATATVTLAKATVAANGSIQNPVIQSVKVGTTTLSSNDYTVAWTDAKGNVVTSIKQPGTYMVTLTGKGGYSGTARATYTVTGKTQTIEGGNATYNKYRGSKEFALGTVGKDQDGNTVTLTYKSSDETIAKVSAAGLVTLQGKAGVAKITVTAPITDYAYEATKEITVVAKPYKAVVKSAKSTEKGKAKVTVAKQLGATQYQVRFSRYSDFRSGSNKYAYIYDNPAYSISQSKTVKSLTSGKTYYVKVRAAYKAADGTTKYGNWSEVKKVTVK